MSSVLASDVNLQVKYVCGKKTIFTGFFTGKIL